MKHTKWMTVGKFVAGFACALFLISLVNCAGTAETVEDIPVVNHDFSTPGTEVITIRKGDSPC